MQRTSLAMLEGICSRPTMQRDRTYWSLSCSIRGMWGHESHTGRRLSEKSRMSVACSYLTIITSVDSNY